MNNARNEALENAVGRGASHVLWLNVNQGAFITVTGEAYRCGSSSVAAVVEENDESDDRTEVSEGKPAQPRKQPDDVRNSKPVLSLGSCFFVSTDGIAITNEHVVQNATRIEVLDSAGVLHNATVLRASPESDLVALDVPTATGAAAMTVDVSGKGVALGQQVFTIGFPYPSKLGIDPKFADGAISGLTGFRDDRLYQLTVPVQPGNSGGPLVTDAGHVVGVITFKLDDIQTLRDTGTVPQNVNFAVKATEIGRLLRGLVLPKSARIKSRAQAIAQTQAAVCQVFALVGRDVAPPTNEAPRKATPQPEPTPEPRADPKPQPEPRVQLDFDSSGLTKEQISNTISSLLPRIEKCKASHDTSKLERVTLSIQVASDGTVTSASEKDQTDSLAKCISVVVKAARFPRSKGGGSFRYSVNVK